MIVGVGIDIIDVRRIKKILSKYGKKFKKRCFLSAEIKKTESKFHVINSYAKIYAAKEACSKALGTGFARGIHWKDIEVNDNIYGKPLINLKGIPMIVRTYNQCKKVVDHSKILVATDDKKILNLCKKNNINVMMTSNKCLTGTDRVA